MKRGKKLLRRMFCLLAALALAVGGILHLPLAAAPTCALLEGNVSLASFAAQIKEAYASELFCKEALLESGGAFARLLGRRSYHGVSVLSNGMLDHDSLEAIDTTALGNEIISLGAYLTALQTPFLFASVPCKTDSDKSLLGAYSKNCGVENAAALCAQLREAGVNVLDLRETLACDREAVERYFYRTDHHWNSDGAFLATQQLLLSLSKTLGREVDMSLADSALWKREVYTSWFLGSHGKRVGRFFGGTDDLIVYTPRFFTQMRMEIPLHGTVLEGSFEETVLKTEYLDRANYYEENPYVCYVGGDYPLVRHRNELAPNGISVLLIKDSFSIPVQAFLSCSVACLDVIDPRYLRGERVEDYLRKGGYDAVVMMINPSVYEDGHYQALLK